MENSLSIDQVKEAFQIEFTKVEIDYSPAGMASGVIHSFFLNFKSVSEMEKQWRKASNFIALNFQNLLKDDFGKWNIYVFYLSEVRIHDDLKYKIENDTFSSRKIVIDVTMSNDEIINEHILNNNLHLPSGKEELSESSFKSNPLIWDVLLGKTLKKKKRTGEADGALNELIELVKKGNNEI